jgi:hypothetical protein
MMKYLEFHSPESCWNRADHNEIVFVLLARDAAAQMAIQAWCEERIRLGKNLPGDPQIVEALECSAKMADQRKRSVGALSPVAAATREQTSSGDVVAGDLEIGVSVYGQVILVHRDLTADEKGVGFIQFSPNQARHLGRTLLRKATEGEALTSTVNSESPDSEKEEGGAK